MSDLLKQLTDVRHGESLTICRRQLGPGGGEAIEFKRSKTGDDHRSFEHSYFVSVRELERLRFPEDMLVRRLEESAQRLREES